MATEVVEDDDVAEAEGWDEELLDPSLKQARSAARKVNVVQRRCGMRPTRR
jgi:hypothetical protein